MPRVRKLARRNPVAANLARALYRKRVELDRKRAAKSGYRKHPSKERVA